MKRTFLYFLILVFTLSFCMTSCKNKSKEATDKDEIVVKDMVTNKNDTAAVESLVNEFFEHLRAKDVDKAVSMLYYLDENGLIIPLPDDMKKGQTRMLKLHSGLKYDIDYIKFHQETDSEVRYTCTLFEKEPGDNRPNKVSFMIRPMRSNNQWYLTMADTDSQHGKSDLFKPKYVKK